MINSQKTQKCKELNQEDHISRQSKAVHSDTTSTMISNTLIVSLKHNIGSCLIQKVSSSTWISRFKELLPEDDNQKTGYPKLKVK